MGLISALGSIRAKGKRKKSQKDAQEEKEELGIMSRAEHEAEKLRIAQRTSTLKGKIWETLENPESSKLGGRISWFMMLTITFSTVILAIETMPALDYVDFKFWVSCEVIVTLIFSAEYGARLACSPSTKFLKYDFILSTMNVIDVIAIIPFYIGLVQNAGLPTSQAEYVQEKEGGQGFLRVLRIIRLTRMLRLLKFGRYSGHLTVFFTTMKSSIGAIVMLMFLLTLNVIFFGALIYEVEKDQIDDGMSLDFESIPQAMWCTLITMSTVGYGDYYPVTWQGKLIMTAAMLAGLMSVVLPVTIVGGESVKEYDNMVKRQQEELLKQGKSSKYLISTEMGDAKDLNEQMQLGYTLEEEYVDPFGRELVAYDLAWGGKIRIAMWEFFEKGETTLSTCWAIFTGLVITMSCMTIILSSVPSLEDTPQSTWFWIETVCIAVFSIEYICRWLLNPELVTDSDPATGVSRFMMKISKGKLSIILAGKVRFMLETFNMIDLLSIIPYYLTMSGHGWDFDKASTSDDGGPYAALRVMRLVRLVRVFKLGKHSDSVEIFTESMKYGSPAMMMLTLFSFCYLLLFGALLYEAERDEPDTGFESIPHAMWWGICTATTVGYGDIFPTTIAGKIIGSIAALVGVIGITLPLSIIGVFFAQISESKQRKKAFDKKTKQTKKRKLEASMQMELLDEEGQQRLKEIEMKKMTAIAECKGKLQTAITEIQEQYPQLRIDAPVSVVSFQDRQLDQTEEELSVETSFS